MHFKMSSAIYFNLVHTKILLFGNGLTMSLQMRMSVPEMYVQMVEPVKILTDHTDVTVHQTGLDQTVDKVSMVKLFL